MSGQTPDTPALPDLDDAWLVVVDPQRIFADPTSEWGSPMFDAALGPITSLRNRRWSGWWSYAAQPSASSKSPTMAKSHDPSPRRRSGPNV